MSFKIYTTDKAIQELKFNVVGYDKGTKLYLDNGDGSNLILNHTGMEFDTVDEAQFFIEYNNLRHFEIEATLSLDPALASIDLSGVDLSEFVPPTSGRSTAVAYTSESLDNMSDEDILELAQFSGIDTTDRNTRRKQIKDLRAMINVAPESDPVIETPVEEVPVEAEVALEPETVIACS